MLAPVTEAAFGEEELLELNLRSARRYPDFISELEAETGVETSYRPSGTLAVAVDRDQVEVLQRLYRFQRSLGLEVEWLRGSECRIREPGLAPRVAGGVRTSVDHQVRPRALAEALRQALERAGGELRLGAAVDSIVATDNVTTGVRLDTGDEIPARNVVVAAGWRSSAIDGLPERARVPVRPVKGQIVRLTGDPRTPLARRVVRTPEVYVVPREDGEVVVGATVEERGADTTVTAGGVFELLRAAYEVLPGVTELALVEAAAGLRPASPDNKPIIGRGALDGLVWATAHWRNGILLAPETAHAIAELLVGGEPEAIAAFSPSRFGAARSGSPVAGAVPGARA
jgi:glycine oxidase